MLINFRVAGAANPSVRDSGLSINRLRLECWRMINMRGANEIQIRILKNPSHQ